MRRNKSLLVDFLSKLLFSFNDHSSYILSKETSYSRAIYKRLMTIYEAILKIKEQEILSQIHKFYSANIVLSPCSFNKIDIDLRIQILAPGTNIMGTKINTVRNCIPNCQTLFTHNYAHHQILLSNKTYAQIYFILRTVIPNAFNGVTELCKENKK